MQQDRPKIIDSHIHLFDPTRAEGVPWPNPRDKIYQPYLACAYQNMAQALGVAGAIAVEASPWLADNDWLLEQVMQSDYFLGCVGNLDLADDAFDSHFERLSQFPKYLGIRSGNLWGYDFAELIMRPQVIQRLQRLAKANKTLDLANPDLRMLHAVIQVKEYVPDLTIVIDHLPNIRLAGSEEVKQFGQYLQVLKTLPRVFIKFSEIAQHDQAHDRFALAHYQRGLDSLWEAFGYRKIMFGSDYPNSEFLGELSSIFQLVEDYLQLKDKTEQAHVWWQNARDAYQSS